MSHRYAVRSPQPIPPLPVGRAVWKPRPDFSPATGLIAGGSNHTALSRALGAGVMADLAEIDGCEFLLIGSDTTVARFKKELRWNDAYHHLAHGLR